MSLVAHYRFEDGYTDSSGNGNDSATSITTASGKLGLALDAEVSSGGSIVLNKLVNKFYFSISYWIRGTGNLPASNYRGVWILQDENAAIYWRADTRTAATPYILHYVKDFTLASYHTVNALPNAEFLGGDWYHIVMTVDDHTVKTYRDNVIINTTTVTKDVESYKQIKYLVLNGNGNTPFHMDDFRLYDHVLSVKEIKHLSQAMVLHYTFDDMQEPTTNLIDPSIIADYSDGTYTRTAPTNVGDTNDGWYYVNATGTSSGNDIICRLDLESIPDGDTVTFSIEFWSPTGNIRPGATGTTGIGDLVNTHNGFWEITWTNSTGSAKSEAIYWRHAGINTSIDEDFWYRHYQIEEKDHATEFIDGSRTGVVRDSSGQGNDSNPLTEALTPQWSEDTKVGKGNYIFSNPVGYISIPDTNLKIVEKLTAMAWVKPSGAITGGANIFTKRPSNQGWIIHNAATNDLLVYVYTNTWYSTQSTSEVYVIGEWVHIAMTWDGTILKGYANGEVVCSTTPSTGGNIINTAGTLTIGNSWFANQSWPGNIKDVRLYAQDLSQLEILEIAQTRASIDNVGNLHANHFKETKLQDRSLIDYDGEWVVGDSGTQGTFILNGSVAENYIKSGIDPWGDSTKIWISVSDGDWSANGGWNKNFTCDSTKRYRMSVFVKKTYPDGDTGSTYLGCMNGTGTLNLNGTANSNPYFWNGEPPSKNEWYLLAGILHPYTSYTPSSWGISGLYDLDGVKQISGTEYKMVNGVTSQRHRTYLYYAASVGVTNEWCYPRIDVIDGSEPSIADLCSGVSSLYEDITNENFEVKGLAVRESTYISTLNEVGPTSGLIAWWKLDGNANDTIGSYNGTLTSGTGGYESGINNLGYLFDGTTDEIDFSNISFTATDSWTASCWVRSDNTSVFNFFLGYAADWAQSFVYDSSNYLGIRWSDGTYAVTADNNRGSWEHICITYNNTAYNIYIDGLIKISGTKSSTMIFNNMGNCYTGTLKLLGMMDDVRIYNRDITAEEASFLYSHYGYGVNQKIRQSRNGIVYSSGQFLENL